MPLFTRRHHNTHSHPRQHHTSTTTPRRGGKLHLFSRNGRSRKENRVAGLKAARTNPRTTGAGRKRAKHELHAMGHTANHVPISTRIRHFFHLGGRRSNRRY